LPFEARAGAGTRVATSAFKGAATG